MAEKWIQKAKAKPGALSKQLGVPEKDRIPISLLEKIRNAEIGTKIKNGKKVIAVTRLLKHRANFALTMKRL